MENEIEASNPPQFTPLTSEENNDSTPWLFRIPGSIQLYIFSLLDYKTICKSSRVSKEWSNKVQQNEIWKNAFAKHFGDVRPFVENISQSNNPPWKSHFISTRKYRGYQWDIVEDQDDGFMIEIKFRVSEGTKGIQVVVVFTSSTIQAGLKNQTAVIEGKLAANIKTSECVWEIDRTSSTVTISLYAEDLKSLFPTAETNFSQPFLIVGPRLDGDANTIDMQSKNILDKKIPMTPLPFANPYAPKLVPVPVPTPLASPTVSQLNPERTLASSKSSESDSVPLNSEPDKPIQFPNSNHIKKSASMSKPATLPKSTLKSTPKSPRSKFQPTPKSKSQSLPKAQSKSPTSKVGPSPAISQKKTKEVRKRPERSWVKPGSFNSKKSNAASEATSDLPIVERTPKAEWLGFGMIVAVLAAVVGGVMYAKNVAFRR